MPPRQTRKKVPRDERFAQAVLKQIAHLATDGDPANIEPLRDRWLK